ncbi:hypothetical protein BDR03DRAFT_947498 [Suillus americanus]|nr:hypothetical protein BDR03DRAFT_947498 [Suillus americanus]
MSEDHGPKLPPEPSGSREATPGESLSQPRRGFCQALRKFKKNAMKKISVRVDMNAGGAEIWLILCRNTSSVPATKPLLYRTPITKVLHRIRILR